MRTQDLTLGRDNLEQIKKSLRQPTPNIRAERLFLYLVRAFPKIGLDLDVSHAALTTSGDPIEQVKSECSGESNKAHAVRVHLRLLSSSSSEDFSEVRYLIQKVLIQEMGVLTFENRYQISPHGWEHYASLQRNPLSAFGFVAMSFKSALRSVWENAFQPFTR